MSNLQPVPRTPEPCEFMPEDYFRRLQPGELFPEDGPLEIDLGCGDGSFVLALARQFPERRFLGVERLLGRVRKVCRQAHREGLENLKVVRLESRYTVEWLLPARSVSRLHLLFPDPWPKARHHKRRIVQAGFLRAVARALSTDGEFLFKTDHPGYFGWTEEAIGACPELIRREWPEDAFFYPETDFERQWKAEGKVPRRLRAAPAGP